MFCLADIESTNAFLELYGLDQLLGVKHVALAWTRFDRLARMCNVFEQIYLMYTLSESSSNYRPRYTPGRQNVATHRTIHHVR